ncbi:MAG: phospholipase D-like domain-containing protein, partial [Gammaproteobacteria bacterium]
GARDHINLESYIIEDDSVGRRLADALIRKQAQGVQVNVIYDGIGSLDTPAEYFQRLKQSGIAVCEFNPVNPLKGRWWRLNQRDHRKILVVDGEVGFTGGINFSRVYASSSARRKRRAASLDEGWRDTHIEVRGPAVAEFQRLFIGTWRKQSCGALAERHYFPQLRAEGDKLVRVIGSSPDSQESLMYLTFLSALGQASERIYLTMAYFVPDPRTLTALKNAAARGVDVRLILPGYSDFWVVFHAGRSYYDELLAAGVKLYERRDALLHAKTAVIDGVWSTVGSTNMDWRSFLHNDEVNVVVLGEEFGQHMDALFQRDLAEATPIDPERWRQRSFGLKAKEWLARHWQYLL